MRLLRGLSGAVTAALALLAILVIAAKLWYSPGPAWDLVIGAIIAATLAIALQRIVDNHTGRPVILAAVANLVILFAGLAVWWWR